MSERYGGWNPTGKPELVTTVTPLDKRGPARLWNAPAGYVVRERGDVDGTVLLEFLCPVHGRFEARVPRSASDEVECPTVTGPACDADEAPESMCFRDGVAFPCCGRPSPWSPSKFAAWQSSGEVRS